MRGQFGMLWYWGRTIPVEAARESPAGFLEREIYGLEHVRFRRSEPSIEN